MKALLIGILMVCTFEAKAQIPADWETKEHFLFQGRVYAVGEASGLADTIEQKAGLQSEARDNAVSNLQEYLGLGQFDSVSVVIIDRSESVVDYGIKLKQLIAITNRSIVSRYLAVNEKNFEAKSRQESKRISEATLRIERAASKEQALRERLEEAERAESRIQDIESRVAGLSSQVRSVKCGLTQAEVHAIFGRPRATARCLDRTTENYGSVWVLYSSGIVSCLVPVGKHSQCVSCGYYTRPCAD